MKLSKREIFMLTFLIVIALVFIEYRFILTPAISNISKLSMEYSDLQSQYQNINFNLTLAKTNEKKRDENLASIDELSVPFLNGVSPDALLVFTHEMMVKHGFLLESYSPAQKDSELLQPELAVVNTLTYRIKQIAEEYRSLGNGATEPTDAGNSGGNDQTSSNNDIVELYQVEVTASGTYDQIKALLDDYSSLAKWIIITNINMTPATDNPAQLYVDFWINYYGIDKLTASSEPMNEWIREPIPSSTDDPFVPQNVTPTPAVTEPTTVPAG